MTEIDDIAARHSVPPDAARQVLDSLLRGGGASAQFDHPALGGMGQWYAPASTMIGDMFNDPLKARVSALCAELAPLAAGRSAAGEREPVHVSTRGLGWSPASGEWWPGALGRPSATGSQNGARYALFPAAGRLALEADGHVTLYDTGAHRITGVSQQQSASRDLSFTSASGSVRLNDLSVLDAPRSGSAIPAHGETETAMAPVDQGPAPDQTEVLDTLERLSELHRKGVLTETEFSAKKAELLARI